MSHSYTVCQRGRLSHFCVTSVQHFKEAGLTHCCVSLYTACQGGRAVSVLCPTLYNLSRRRVCLSAVSHSIQPVKEVGQSQCCVPFCKQPVKEAGLSHCCVPLYTACLGGRAVSVLCPILQTACQGCRAVSLLCPTLYSPSWRQGGLSAVSHSIQHVKEVRLSHCCVTSIQPVEVGLSQCCVPLYTACQGGRAVSLLCHLYMAY